MKQKMIVTKVYEKEIYMFSDLEMANLPVLLDLTHENSIEMYQAETWLSIDIQTFDRMCEIITKMREGNSKKEKKNSRKKNTGK